MDDVEYLKEEAQRCRNAAAALTNNAAAIKLAQMASELEALAVALQREFARPEGSPLAAW